MGLDGPRLPDPAFCPQAPTALELGWPNACARARSRSPWCRPALTNIALLLAAHPELKQKIARIVLMGGAAGRRATGPRRRNSIFMGPGSGRYGVQVGAAHHHAGST